MKKKAVFPGSFDPITIGHQDIVERAIPLFDEIIVALGNNAQKNYMFDLAQRKKWVEESFKHQPKVRVDIYQGLTVEYCKKIQARYLLRGVRNIQDFEFERNIAQMNKRLNDEIETILLYTLPEHSAISSTIVRDIYRNGGDVLQFLPKNIQFNP